MRSAEKLVIFGIALLAASSTSAGAQQLDASAVALTRRPEAVGAFYQPPGERVFLAATAMGAGFAVSGASLGFLIDAVICEKRHGDEQYTLFGPCFFYAGTPTAVGWFGGAAIGATAGAAIMANRRGCPARTATWRALAGALIGVAPGVAATIHGGDKFPASRSALIFTAPLVSGLGAAAAVVGCHR